MLKSALARSIAGSLWNLHMQEAADKASPWAGVRLEAPNQAEIPQWLNQVSLTHGERLEEAFDLVLDEVRKKKICC